MRLAVFVKLEHESRISHVNTASVKTGLGNTLGTLPSISHIISHVTNTEKKIQKVKSVMVDSQKYQCMIKKHKVCFYDLGGLKLSIFVVSGNKGAVGISFLFNGTSFGFVNCHLTSGSEKVLR